MTLEITNANTIQLYLKQSYTSSKPVYQFNLCCKSLLKIHNPCPKQLIAFKICKCVEVLDTIFCVTDVSIDYQLINTMSSNRQASFECVNGYYLLKLETDTTEYSNNLCINNIILTVSADCLDKNNIGKCAPLSKFINLVCTKYTTPERLFDCYISMYNTIEPITTIVSSDSTDAINNDKTNVINDFITKLNNLNLITLSDVTIDELVVLSNLTIINEIKPFFESRNELVQNELLSAFGVYKDIVFSSGLQLCECYVELYNIIDNPLPTPFTCDDTDTIDGTRASTLVNNINNLVSLDTDTFNTLDNIDELAVSFDNLQIYFGLLSTSAQNKILSAFNEYKNEIEQLSRSLCECYVDIYNTSTPSPPAQIDCDQTIAIDSDTVNNVYDDINANISIEASESDVLLAIEIVVSTSDQLTQYFKDRGIIFMQLLFDSFEEYKNLP